MAPPRRKVRVAVPQVEPVWLDLEGGILKTIQLIEEAAHNGAELIAFSECWIPGYPGFLWAKTFKDYIPLVKRYHENSIEIKGPEYARIRAACRDNHIMVMFGFVENLEGSLYMAQSLIGNDGEVLMHRHKTKPTHVERVLFGDSSGDSVRNVVSTPLGNIGGLQCWEHLQPLLKYHTYSQSEHIHIAAWPTNHRWGGWEPWSFSTEAAVVASRLYAMESQAFTIVATQCQTEKALIAFGDEEGSASHMAQTGGGFTAIYGPDGRKLTRDVAPDWEGVLYADLDMSDIAFAKSVADPVGHYSRPDLFTLVVDDRRKEHVLYGKKDGLEAPENMLGSIPELVDAVVQSEPVVKVNGIKPLPNGTSHS